MQCRNCGAPIRKADYNDYLIHDRPGMGRIWCYPGVDPYDPKFIQKAVASVYGI